MIMIMIMIFFSEAVPYCPRITSDAPGGCCYMRPIRVYCHDNNNNNNNNNNKLL